MFLKILVEIKVKQYKICPEPENNWHQLDKAPTPFSQHLVISFIINLNILIGVMLMSISLYCFINLWQ